MMAKNFQTELLMISHTKNLLKDIAAIHRKEKYVLKIVIVLLEIY